jgi:hypothetical protein
MQRITDAEGEKRIQAWADVTKLSLELKSSAPRKKYPELDERRIAEMVREELPG